MGYWLKAIGHAKGPLPAEWRPRALERTGFPRRPRIEPGDRLVYYASVWKRIFAIVEVTGEPEFDGHPRWPWSVTVRPLSTIADLDDAPPIEECGVAARSMAQQSHISITPEQYRSAERLIRSRAGRVANRYDSFRDR